MSNLYVELIKQGKLNGKLRAVKIKDGKVKPDPYTEWKDGKDNLGCAYYPSKDEVGFDIDAKILDEDGNVLDKVCDSDTNKFICKGEDVPSEILKLVGQGGTYGNNTTKGHHVICSVRKSRFKKNHKIYYKGIPFHIRAMTGEKIGCPLFGDGTRKEGKGITHHAYKDMMDRSLLPLPEDMEKEMVGISEAKSKPTTNQESKKDVKVKRNSRKIVSYLITGKRIPKGDRHDALRDTSRSLVGKGINVEDVKTIIHNLNKTACEEAKPDNEIDQNIFHDIDKFIEENGIETPFNLVMNTHYKGIPAIIEQTMETMGYEFRKNIRKEGLDFRRKDGEWETEDISDVRDQMAVEAQNTTKHSFTFDVKIHEGNGNFLRCENEVKPFAFSELDIKRTFKDIMRKNQYDPLVEWLLDGYEDYAVKLREQYKEDGKEGVIKHWECFNAHFEILGFKKTPDVKSQGFIETDTDYNKWLIYNLIAPAIHNTVMEEAKEFPVVVMIGGEGCFKSSLPKMIIPKHLRFDHHHIGRFDMPLADLGRMFATAIILSFDEAIGFTRSLGVSKVLLSETKDSWTPKFKEGCKAKRRQCSWNMASNISQPLAYSPDNQRRFYVVYLYRNEDVNARGEKENKFISDYVDYLEEWMEKYQKIVWQQIYFLIKECGWGLGFNDNELEKKRIKYVLHACKYSDFRYQVTKAFEYFIENGHIAVNYEMVYEQTEVSYKKQSKLRDDTIKEVYREMGGGSEMGRGSWQMLTYKKEFEKEEEVFETKRGRYFDIELLRETYDSSDLLSEMDKEDRENTVSEATIQEEQLERKLKEEGDAR